MYILPGLPSAPQNPTPMVHYGPHNITIVVQWDHPQSDGGTPADNYTISLIGPGAVHISTTTSFQAMTTFILDYNEEYTVNIAATNCAGTGGAVSLNISEGTGTQLLLLESCFSGMCTTVHSPPLIDSSHFSHYVLHIIVS